MNSISLISGRCYEIEFRDGRVVVGKITDAGSGSAPLFEIPPGGPLVDVYGQGGKVHEGKVPCGDDSDDYPG